MHNDWIQYLSNQWLWWILFAAYCITILSVVGVVVSENRNPLKSLAWVCVLVLFPFGGLILYIFFGRSIKNTRMISRRKRRRLMRAEKEGDGAPEADRNRLGPASRSVSNLARNLTTARLHDANRVEVLTDGKAKIDALFDDIRSARSFINLQYYIIEDDDIGSQLGELLLEKAAQGVKVRVIYDDIGSISMSRRFIKKLRNGDIEIYPFSRVAFPPFATRINWRNHRKVCVIDGRVGYIGGMNIADRYIDGGKKFNLWRDTHLRVTGPAVASLQYSFAVDWSYMGRTLLDEETASAVKAVADTSRGMPASLQLITSGPTSRWSNIALTMLRAIGCARRRIYIQTPYFLPTESLLRALQAAALARVDVRVMIPVHSDSNMLTHASRSYISECLRAGIKFYLYEAGMLHAKTLVIDDDISSVGSTNFDFRSFEHNFEGNFFIFSRPVNQRLADDFHADMRQSKRIRPNDWRSRPLFNKVSESIIRLLSPIL